MSTKIYDGLKVTDDNIFNVARRVNDLLFPIVADEFYRLYDQVMRHVGDGWDAVFPLCDDTSIIEDKHKIFLRRDLFNKLLNSDNDFSIKSPLYKAFVFENANGDDKPLMLIFSDFSDGYIKILKDAGIVVDYSYWNNTDKPKNISGDEWGKRKAAWDNISIPATDGLMLPTPTLIDIELSRR